MDNLFAPMRARCYDRLSVCPALRLGRIIYYRRMTPLNSERGVLRLLLNFFFCKSMYLSKSKNNTFKFIMTEMTFNYPLPLPPAPPTPPPFPGASPHRPTTPTPRPRQRSFKLTRLRPARRRRPSQDNFTRGVRQTKRLLNCRSALE
ncbi:hypothetical protein EVAR_76746_1 [Eumeta japonica]|uniref:Uncharacterized protein n=1 Tax=Eumeta variegata TaxID=151549 RepID=A0A4C1STM2_EUMVA|nr:hypothetical protein EVAR_76746_1 [Eumeta japonica]